MAFTLEEFPSSDYYDSDLRKILKYMREFEIRLDNISEDILKQAKEYTDEQLTYYQKQVEDLRIEFTTLVNSLSTQFIELKQSVNESLIQIDLKLLALENLIAAEVEAVNRRTDIRIEQNNEYILSEVGKFLSRITVLNYFTGDYITIQEMFDYLAKLHATDGITVSDLASRQKDVDTLVALNMTMTQLAVNGKNIIPL